MANGTPNFQDAHPRAKALMTELFYFSPIEETGPFGSDDGSDSFAGFQHWRSLHPDDNPLIFLEQQFASWGYAPFDLHVTDPEIILNYCHEHELGSTFLTGMDSAIVAVAFGQLYLDGIIHPELNKLAITAIRRQLSFYLLQLWDGEYRPTREEQLTIMLNAIRQVGLAQ